ncbi:hypothetical protein D3C86_1660770 [compost metagenome]
MGFGHVLFHQEGNPEVLALLSTTDRVAQFGEVVQHLADAGIFDTTGLRPPLAQFGAGELHGDVFEEPGFQVQFETVGEDFANIVSEGFGADFLGHETFLTIKVFDLVE